MENKKRLIDVDEVLKKLRKVEPSLKVVSAVGLKAVSVDTVIQFLERQKTVDAVEVVHGRWIAVPSSDMMTGKAYKCSECNKMRYGSFMPNYCAICGAKMDRKDDT